MTNKSSYITKRKQVTSAIINGNHVKLDISTTKHTNTYMECNLSDYQLWKNEPSYGRIYAKQDNNNNYPYAVFNVKSDKTKNKINYFHRLVCPNFNVIDHEDRDGLNNKKSNLRNGTEGNQWNRKPNKNNTSGFTGVSFDKATKKWQSQIRIHGKNKNLGRFTTPELASSAYQKAKQELHQIGA